jgi:hypothetical protein
MFPRYRSNQQRQKIFGLTAPDHSVIGALLGVVACPP